MAHNDEAPASDPLRMKLAFDPHQQGHVLLDRKPPHVTQDEWLIFGGRGRQGTCAQCGREQACVYSALHQVAWLSCGIGEHSAELLVGRKQDTCECVKP